MSDHGDRPSEPRSQLATGRAQSRGVAWSQWPTVRRVAATILLVTVVDFAVVAWFSQDPEPPPSSSFGVAARGPTASFGRTGHHLPLSASVTAIAPITRVLAYTPAVSVGSSHRRDVALTFDDGPGPYTTRILSVLRRTHTPATFFAVGQWALSNPGLVRAEVRGGNEIGDHTQTHAFMSALGASAQRAQIVEAARAIERAGGPAPHLWRPPYGAFNSTTLAILRSLRMLNVLWTVDTDDWARPGAARIAVAAIDGARPGAIILMHDGGGDRSQTVAALPRIITTLRRRGYRLVTVSQLLADDPPPRGAPRRIASSGAESGARAPTPPRRTVRPR